MAASVSTRRRQEDDCRRDGPAGQGQLAATPGETRSRPEADARDRQRPGLPSTSSIASHNRWPAATRCRRWMTAVVATIATRGSVGPGVGRSTQAMKVSLVVGAQWVSECPVRVALVTMANAPTCSAKPSAPSGIRSGAARPARATRPAMPTRWQSAGASAAGAPAQTLAACRASATPCRAQVRSPAIAVRPAAHNAQALRLGHGAQEHSRWRSQRVA